MRISDWSSDVCSSDLHKNWCRWIMRLAAENAGQPILRPERHQNLRTHAFTHSVRPMSCTTRSMLGDMNMVESTLVLPPNRGASSGRTKVRALDTACVAEPERSTIHTGTCGVTLVTRDKDTRPARNRGDTAYPIN